jgi:hypothetical protein
MPAARPRLIEGPRTYAYVAVKRRLRSNVAVYLAVATALTVPGIAYLCRRTIEEQGAVLGGAHAASRYVLAVELIALMGAIVGLIQIALVLGRTFSARKPEFQLLLAIAATPSQTFRAVLIESILHASLGWVAAGTITVGLAAAAYFFLDVPFPDLRDMVLVGIAFVPLAFAAVVLPSVIFVRALSRVASASYQVKA